MKKMYIALGFIGTLFFVSVCWAGYLTLQNSHYEKQHEALLSSLQQKEKGQRGATSPHYEYQKEQSLSEHFFDIYHTFNSKEDFETRKQRLNQNATKDVLSNTKLFSSDEYNKQSFVETSNLQSKTGEIVYYPRTTNTGTVTVQIQGRYDQDEKTDASNVGSVVLVYDVKLNERKDKFSKVKYLGNEYLLNDTELIRNLNETK